MPDRLARVVAWATASRLRMAMAIGAGLIPLGTVFALWSYFGELSAVRADPKIVTLAVAALDQQRYGEAKSLVGQMQQLPATPGELSDALYVLGAVRSHEADGEPTPGGRRAMHEMAARYLKKAIKLGVSEAHEDQATFLLGKSLAHSGQAAEAIPQLEKALHDAPHRRTEIHGLLVAALLQGPEPRLDDALKHNQRVLADPDLSDEARQRAHLTAAEALVRLGRFDDAGQSLAHVEAGSRDDARRLLLLGRLKIEQAKKLDGGAVERAALLTAAGEDLGRVSSLAGEHSPLSRQAALWLAELHELNNEHRAAMAEYDRIGKLYADTPEGLVAAMAAADYRRRDGKLEAALAGYRSVLRAIGAELAYDNALLPLADVRRRMTEAYQQCIDQQLFSEALALVDLFEPVFGDVSSMELRAKTHQAWGANRVAAAHGGDYWQDLEVRRAGRSHFRAAGRAYEDLARLRFAAREFTDDLWTAAECYFEGQSFTRAAKIYQEYLHHEARSRNANALLRLGQSLLAGGDYDRAAAALQECMEMYPNDPFAHQARLECARAYEQSGRRDEAEALLLANLAGDRLTPASPEWRDSLFALGNLLFQSGRYEESIIKLQEAVERYPRETAALWAKYTIARAFHAASAEPTARLAESKTDNERQNARALSTELLTEAHAYYQAVERELTLRGRGESDPLNLALRRNCYLMQGSVLFELRRFEDSLQAYGNVITSYQRDPIALASFVQMANCWRRLDQPVKARVTLDQAKLVMDEMPPETDFLAATNFNRQQWELLLNQMSQW